MLADLEEKFAGIIADGLTERAHLDVFGGAPATPQRGRGSVGAAIAAIEHDSGFSPSDTLTVGSLGEPQSRRVLTINFAADVVFRLNPSANGTAAQRRARALILEDLSVVAHLLADLAVLDGSAFAVADPDPGFLVTRLGLESGVSDPEQEDGLFTASLRYRGGARIWPVGAAQAEGLIEQHDTVIAPLPLLLSVNRSAVRPEGEARISGATGQLQRADGVGGIDLANIAVSVQADVPFDQRGIVQGGVAGGETGVRILTLGENGEIDIRYQAPADDPGPGGRMEYVVVHLATPDGERGVFLGLAAIRLVPAS